MAHFAEIDPIYNGVLGVYVIRNEDLLDEHGIEREEVGIDFCKKIFGQDKIFVQTSYNGKFRGKYAAIGDTYSRELDAFIPSKPPYPSWIFDNKLKTYVAPVSKPEEKEGYYCAWDEEDQEWFYVLNKGNIT